MFGEDNIALMTVSLDELCTPHKCFDCLGLVHMLTPFALAEHNRPPPGICSDYIYIYLLALSWISSPPSTKLTRKKRKPPRPI